MGADPQLDLRTDDPEGGMPLQIGLGDLPVGDPAVAGQFRNLGDPHPNLGHVVGHETPVDEHLHTPEDP